MMRKLGVVFGGFGGVMALVGGCQLIAGIDDAVSYPPDAGTGGNGGAGASSSGGTGGAGGAMSCAPGSMIACYSGPDGTKGVGICAAGQQTCRKDGSGYDACVGEVKPKTESCAAAEDENCDGHDCVQWAELFGDGADQQATALAVDSQGNIFVVGTFAGEIAIDGAKIDSMGSTDMFVLKLDPGGKVLWGKAFGDAGTQEGQAVTVDSTGSVVLAGFTSTQISLGDPQMKMTPPGLFVVKLDGTGSVIWSNGFGALGCGGTKDSAIASMAVTSGNDVVIAGRYCGSIDFGNGPIPSQMGSQDGFLVRLGGGSGSATNGGWAKVFGDGDQQNASGVAVSGGSGDVTVVGDFKGVANFGTLATTITSAGGYDIFITRFSADGTPISSARFGDMTNQSAAAMTIDAAGNLYVTGGFRGTISFGIESVTAPASTLNAYIVKFDSSISYKWSKTYGGDNFYGTASDISVDAMSNIIVAGNYVGNIDFGAGPITSKGANTDIFLAKLGPAGEPLWTKTFDDGSGLLLGRMSLSLAMDPVLTGFTSNSTNFGTLPLTPAGNKDGFVAQFAP